MANCAHQSCWRCKLYQYEKRDHVLVCFWLLPTATFDDMNLKNLELITRRLKNRYFNAWFVTRNKKLLNIIPCCPDHAIYIDSFTLKENEVTITLDYLYQENAYLTNYPGNGGSTKFHDYLNKSAFKSKLFVWSLQILNFNLRKI